MRAHKVLQRISDFHPHRRVTKKMGFAKRPLSDGLKNPHCAIQKQSTVVKVVVDNS
jgi:hypothetical protein